jgi:hypothetical protein
MLLENMTNRGVYKKREITGLFMQRQGEAKS